MVLVGSIASWFGTSQGQIWIWNFRSFRSLSRVQLFATSWTAARQASLSIKNSQSLLQLMSIESVMPPNHLILCCPLVLLPSVFPSIRVFSRESALRIRWPKYWNFSFSISLSNEYLRLISFKIDWCETWSYQILAVAMSNLLIFCESLFPNLQIKMISIL